MAPATASAEFLGVDLAPLLIKNGDMPNFRPTLTPFEPYGLQGWLGHLRYEGAEREEVEARLSAEKWVTGFDVKLIAPKGTSGEGVEILEEFEGAADARAEMAAKLKKDLEPESRRPGETVKFFRVPGVAGAKAFELVSRGRVRAANALVVIGPVLVVIGAFEPKGDAQADVTAGVQAVFKRSRG